MQVSCKRCDLGRRRPESAGKTQTSTAWGLFTPSATQRPRSLFHTQRGAVLKPSGFLRRESRAR